MRRVFIDSNLPIYALGGDSEHKRACLSVLERARRRELELHASVELVQEFTFHRLRRVSREDAVTQARFVAAACVLHPFDVPVLERSLGLVERDGMRGRDAVHAATALIAGFSEIITVDPDFDSCRELSRIEPGAL